MTEPEERYGPKPTVLELCAGAGGQALGLEQAGFAMAAAIELEPAACETLRINRPDWDVRQQDLREFDAREFAGVDLVAAGVPCPPFSIAGKQLGSDDERDLFPAALKIIRQVRPRAVMLENVRGMATRRFEGYRHRLQAKLSKLGYQSEWQVLNASDYGVPQLRPRWILVALRADSFPYFDWPAEGPAKHTVGDALADLMSENGWSGTGAWRLRASVVAPTLVGGSKKHGGPDLGPTRAKAQWRSLGVDGLGLANEPPGPDFPADGDPRLTIRMVARLQGFPDDWKFSGRKTAQYRQVGNAFPPPVARAVGVSVAAALSGNVSTHRRRLLEPELDAVAGA